MKLRLFWKKFTEAVIASTPETLNACEWACHKVDCTQATFEKCEKRLAALSQTEPKKV